MTKCACDGRENDSITIAPGVVAKHEDDIDTVSVFFTEKVTDIDNDDIGSVVFCDSFIAKVYLNAKGKSWGCSGRPGCFFLFSEQRRQGIVRFPSTPAQAR